MASSVLVSAPETPVTPVYSQSYGSTRNFSREWEAAAMRNWSASQGSPTLVPTPSNLPPFFNCCPQEAPPDKRKGYVPQTARTAKRGVGMTPRLFEAVVGAPDATIDARPSTFVPAISQHMQSVAPSKQVIAEYWCPILVEDDAGARRVLHVDPLAVRKFRRSVAEELRGVQEKRRRMLSRIKTLRQDLPPARTKDVSLRLSKEIAEAEEKVKDQMLQPLQNDTRCLHVYLEITQNMLQLNLVCEHLLRELPRIMREAGVNSVSMAILSINKADTDGAPSPIESASVEEACSWLSSLSAAYKSRPLANRRKANSRKSKKSITKLKYADALQQATTAETLGSLGSSSSNGKNAILLIVCTPPSDLDECVAIMRRSALVLQVVGVFGLCPEDPEPALEKIVDASAAQSSMKLFFGREYWTKFAAKRRLQLERLARQREQKKGASATSGDAETAENEQPHLDHDSEDSDVVSPKVFEMRLIERIMWECYIEELRCEEELSCAGKVLERTLVDREDILATMRSPPQPSYPTSARNSSAPPPRLISPGAQSL